MLPVTIRTERTTMGVTNRYLGHVEIRPPLNQAEYDYLRAVSRGQVRLVGPDDLEPWCPWEPCPHGCCLRWDGSASYGTGAEGLQMLINHFLSPVDPDDPVDSLDATELTGFTFDHETNGVLACEADDRGLLLLRVDCGKVRTEMLLRGDPSPWELGREAPRELPWLADGPRASERYRLENAAVLAEARASAAVEGG
jgi:hypothetical protein